MGRHTNSKVVKLWASGSPVSTGTKVSNHRETLIAYPDGTLFSYGLKIGHRNSVGVLIVGDYTASGGGFKSQTTSCHVGLAKRLTGATVFHSKVWETSPFHLPVIPF